jgi:hypothetical protein
VLPYIRYGIFVSTVLFFVIFFLTFSCWNFELPDQEKDIDPTFSHCLSQIRETLDTLSTEIFQVLIIICDCGNHIVDNKQISSMVTMVN